jgi:hypothetical protein
MNLLPIWFNLSDPAAEDAIYDSYVMRKFTDTDFMTEEVRMKQRCTNLYVLAIAGRKLSTT